MIDTLIALRERIEAIDAPARHDVEPGTYLVVTLHRHWLFEQTALLAAYLSRLAEIAEDLVIVFPMHPRTAAAIDGFDLRFDTRRLRLLAPLGYLEFLGLVSGAAGVLTDSGGIQEETTFLGIPCFTLRPNTERPITVEMGTNVLLGLDPDRIIAVPGLIRDQKRKTERVPPLWDGKASTRIVETLASQLERARSPAISRK
jgi:UDP-N-acetylglucosamine 2-epimerase (non-hydrolysing)